MDTSLDVYRQGTESGSGKHRKRVYPQPDQVKGYFARLLGLIDDDAEADAPTTADGATDYDALLRRAGFDPATLPLAADDEPDDDEDDEPETGPAATAE